MPTPILKYLFIQLHTPNKATLKFGKGKVIQSLEIEEHWIKHRRAIAVLLNKLKQI